VYIDKKRNSNIKNDNPLTYILPRKNEVWINDNSVKTCYNCKISFGITLRKHHCRLCGRIFCYKCSKYHVKIPEVLKTDKIANIVTWNEYAKSYISNINDNNYKQRVCSNCNNVINEVNRVNAIMTMFMNMGISIKTLKKLCQVCKLWNNASNCCLSIFKDIQYKLPCDNYTKFEKNILQRNVKYFNVHSRYILHLIKICETMDELKNIVNILSNPKKVTCWSMMCSKSCKKKPTFSDAVVILDNVYRRDIYDGLLIKLALKFMTGKQNELICHMPFLVYHLRHDIDDILSEYLFARALKNSKILNNLYWELKLYSDDKYHIENYDKLLKKIRTKMNADIIEKLSEGQAFIKTIERISSDIWVNHKKYEDIKNDFILPKSTVNPLDIDIFIDKILIDEIKMKDSASRPLLIPCEKKDGSTYNMLYKIDDIRKDQTIINIIRLADILVERDEGIKLETKTYNVMPTSKNKGFIEIIDNADTIYHIKEKLQTTILNYIIEGNEDKPINEYRDILVKSMATYCVISYLMGIGDRHLDNIMVCKDGNLFHIDFGYIIGEDPKMSDPGIRITTDMIDAIGGFTSKRYPEFKKLCNIIFNCMRKNIDIFIVMLMLLPKVSSIKLTEDEIRERTIKRFAPSESYEEAELHFINQLECDTYAHKIIDFCHYHSKEKTINGVMDTFTSVVSSITSLFYL
jgi:phosphatidylinositol 3-kinase